MVQSVVHSKPPESEQQAFDQQRIQQQVGDDLIDQNKQFVQETNKSEKGLEIKEKQLDK
jgi:hypothetical protein